MIDEKQIFDELDIRAAKYREQLYVVQPGQGKFLYFSLERNVPLVEYTVYLKQHNPFAPPQIIIEEFEYRNKLWQ